MEGQLILLDLVSTLPLLLQSIDSLSYLLLEFTACNFLLQIVKELSLKWNALSVEEKKKFNDMAAEDKKRYQQEMKNKENVNPEN